MVVVLAAAVVVVAVAAVVVVVVVAVDGRVVRLAVNIVHSSRFCIL